MYLIAMFALMWLIFLSKWLDCAVNTDDVRQGLCKHAVGYTTLVSTYPPITQSCDLPAQLDDGRLNMVCSHSRSALLGIPFSWLCHLNLQHIGLNSCFFLVFGGFIILRFGGPWRFLLACFWSQLATGLTWLTRGACGASGMIFGLFAFTLTMGLMKALGMPPRPDRCSAGSCGGCCGCLCDYLAQWSKAWLCTFSTVGDFAISLVLVFIFRMMFWGLVPSNDELDGRPISWEGHLFGFLGGATYAAFLARRDRRAILAKRTTQPPTVLVHSTPAATTTNNPFFTQPTECVPSATPQPAACPPAPAAATTKNPFFSSKSPSAVTSSAPTESAGYRI